MELLVFILVILGTWLYSVVQSTKKRRATLLAKYGDPDLVEMIMQRKIWQGQTHEQLTDSLGTPLDIDQRVLKTKTKETWKYHSIGKNRFGLRVILENGVVVGWDKK